LMTLLGFKMHYMENKGRDTCQTQNPWQRMPCWVR
jgi:hypothetical protein